jgi:hypothetical protein
MIIEVNHIKKIELVAAHAPHRPHAKSLYNIRIEIEDCDWAKAVRENFDVYDILEAMSEEERESILDYYEREKR